eukprot:jgi/Chrpa1/17173/Chrysochromulina_OHIO_Genome00000984-RA
MVCGSACAQRARVFTQRHAERHDELEDVCAARLPNLVVALLTRERLHCLLARQVRPRAPLLEISPEDLAQPLRRRRTRLGSLWLAEGRRARRDEQKQQLQQHVKDAHRLHHQRVERLGGLVRRRCGDEGRGGGVGGRCLDSQQRLLGGLRRHARDFGRGRDAVVLPYHPARAGREGRFAGRHVPMVAVVPDTPAADARGIPVAACPVGVTPIDVGAVGVAEEGLAVGEGCELGRLLFLGYDPVEAITHVQARARNDKIPKHAELCEVLGDAAAAAVAAARRLGGRGRGHGRGARSGARGSPAQPAGDALLKGAQPAHDFVASGVEGVENLVALSEHFVASCDRLIEQHLRRRRRARRNNLSTHAKPKGGGGRALAHGGVGGVVHHRAHGERVEGLQKLQQQLRVAVYHCLATTRAQSVPALLRRQRRRIVWGACRQAQSHGRGPSEEVLGASAQASEDFDARHACGDHRGLFRVPREQLLVGEPRGRVAHDLEASCHWRGRRRRRVQMRAHDDTEPQKFGGCGGRRLSEARAEAYHRLEEPLQHHAARSLHLRRVAAALRHHQDHVERAPRATRDQSAAAARLADEQRLHPGTAAANAEFRGECLDRIRAQQLDEEGAAECRDGRHRFLVEGGSEHRRRMGLPERGCGGERAAIVGAQPQPERKRLELTSLQLQRRARARREEGGHEGRRVDSRAGRFGSLFGGAA